MGQSDRITSDLVVNPSASRATNVIPQQVALWNPDGTAFTGGGGGGGGGLNQSDPDQFTVGSTSNAGGEAGGGGEIVADGGGGNFATGWATGANSLIEADEEGTFATGYAAGGGKIIADADGSSAFGYAVGDGRIYSDSYGGIASGSASGTAEIRTGGQGSHAFGYADGTTPGGVASTVGAGFARYGNGDERSLQAPNGAFASGHASDGGQIMAMDPGCVAMGVATGVSAHDALGFSYIEAGSNYPLADAKPTFAWGWAKDGGYIGTDESASVLMGWANGTSPTGEQSYLYSGQPYSVIFGAATDGGKLYGGGYGSFTMGFAKGADSTIWANRRGSVAFGYAEAGEAINANGVNAAQFGVGENTQPTSLAVGTDIRIGSTTPGTPRNGDIWAANGYLYGHTNNVTGKIQVA